MKWFELLSKQSTILLLSVTVMLAIEFVNTAQDKENIEHRGQDGQDKGGQDGQGKGGQNDGSPDLSKLKCVSEEQVRDKCKLLKDDKDLSCKDMIEMANCALDMVCDPSAHCTPKERYDSNGIIYTYFFMMNYAECPKDFLNIKWLCGDRGENGGEGRDALATGGSGVVLYAIIGCVLVVLVIVVGVVMYYFFGMSNSTRNGPQVSSAGKSTKSAGGAGKSKKSSTKSGVKGSGKSANK